ncbi:MAG: peptidoglycan DD-metalloendopeptidase family protein [Steroidobacter sp.]
MASITSRSLGPVLLSLALLAGCASNSSSTSPQANRQGTYTVKRGDTLSEIARRHKIDFRDLARWNRIGRDYVIHPGQTLQLYPPSRNAAAAPRPSASQRSASQNVGPKKSQAGKTAKPGSTSKPRKVASASPKARSRTPITRPAPPKRSAPIPTGPPVKWQWPVAGGTATLTTRPNGGNGLTIVGKLGEDIRSASGGKVVYTGSGLLGYGQLVIIKHNESYLSASGQLQSVAVSDGDAVSAGQRIATMGNGPQGSPLLYFEIRVNGTPSNPLALLPQR